MTTRTSEHRRRHARARLAAVPIATVALLLAIAAPGHGVDPVEQAAGDELQSIVDEIIEVTATQAGGIAAAGDSIPFSETAMYFEENATDGDLGIQLFLDGEPWERVVIRTPGNARLVDIKVKGDARVIGLTEIFSESAEPSFDELPREEFLALFPAGEYPMAGRTIEGDWLFGSATLTQDMPDQPEICTPEEDDEVDADAPLLIEWQTVPDPDPPASVIEAYHVVVEKDEDDERLRVWTVDMLPGDNGVTLPVGFLEAGKDYKVEILAIETSGNRTITEVPFETGD